MLALRAAPVPVAVAGGALDLDHLGAHVAQVLSRGGPLHGGRELDHQDAGERPGAALGRFGR